MEFFRIFINEVEQTSAHVRANETCRIEASLGARTRAELEVRDYDSFATAYRVDLDERVRVARNAGGNQFTGAVATVRDFPLGAPGVGTVTALQAMDDWSAASYRLVAKTYPAGQTLKQIVTDLMTLLAPFNLTLDPAMGDGPVLEEITFDYATVEAAFNRLATITNWVYRLTPDNVVQWFPIGGKARGITFSAANNNILGAIEWTRTAINYVNRVFLRYGTGLVDKSEDFVGDGVTRSFPLALPLATAGWIKYPGVLDQEARTQCWPGVGVAQPGGLEYYQTDYPALQEYQNQWPNQVTVTPPVGGYSFPIDWGPLRVLPGSYWWWDPANHCVVHLQQDSGDPNVPAIIPASTQVCTAQAYLALSQEGVGPGWKWHYDAATNAIVSDYPNPPRAGLAFTFEYQVQFPLMVTVEDAADIAVYGPSEGLFSRTDIFDAAQAQVEAQRLLQIWGPTPRTARFPTRVQHDFLPGDTVQLDVPERTLPNAPWLVTEVVVQPDVDQMLTTTLTLLEGNETQGSWIDFWRRTLGAGGTGTSSPASGSSGTGTTAAVSLAGGYFLGASAIEWQQTNPVQWIAAGGIQFVARRTGGGIVTARLRVRAGDVSARLYDVTAGASAGATAAPVATATFSTVRFAVTLTLDHTYELQLLPSLVDTDVQGIGYLELE